MGGFRHVQMGGLGGGVDTGIVYSWVSCLLMGMGGLERERDVYRNGK